MEEKQKKEIKINLKVFVLILAYLIILTIAVIILLSMMFKRISDIQKYETAQRVKYEESVSEKQTEKEDEEFSYQNIGRIVNYSITVNNTVLNKWKIFYPDNENRLVYIIYDGLLPNSTNLAKNAGLSQDENQYSDYGVYSKISRTDLLNKLNGVRNYDAWNELLTPELYSCGAIAKGGIDIETWVKSWNASGYTELKLDTVDFSDGTKGYVVGTESFKPTDMLSISSDIEGYNDKLYFPKINDNNQEQGNPYYGYWIASPSGMGNGYLMMASDEGKLGDNLHGFSDAKGVGIRPVIGIPFEYLQKSKDKVNTWDIKT